jgi:SAM-dependent methyltransferase
MTGPLPTGVPRRIVRGARRRLLRAIGRAPAPGPWKVRPAAVPIQVATTPPVIDEPMARGPAVAQRARLAEAMDIELFEALNREYAGKPLVPVPMAYDHDRLVSRSISRLRAIHAAIDLADRDVLVFGCGNGYEVWFLAEAYRARATGIDIVQHGAWAPLEGPGRRFVLADIAADRPFEAESFDRIFSINVFEHVSHPRTTLAELYRVLRPGGLASITANLHRGPKASHRYREVFFPWPHLLFDDAVFREFYRRQGLPEDEAEWVNRLTWEQYRAEIEALGFVIRREKLLETPIDEALYARFEWILGRYPRADLERDFFEVILEKPPASGGSSRPV